LSPHPSGLTSRGSTFIDNLAWTLGHFIALPMNASRGSIVAIDDIMYLAGHSSILGILVMVYDTLYGV